MPVAGGTQGAKARKMPINFKKASNRKVARKARRGGRS